MKKKRVVAYCLILIEKLEEEKRIQEELERKRLEEEERQRKIEEEKRRVEEEKRRAEEEKRLIEEAVSYIYITVCSREWSSGTASCAKTEMSPSSPRRRTWIPNTCCAIPCPTPAMRGT